MDTPRRPDDHCIRFRPMRHGPDLLLPTLTCDAARRPCDPATREDDVAGGGHDAAAPATMLQGGRAVQQDGSGAAGWKTGPLHGRRHAAPGPAILHGWLPCSGIRYPMTSPRPEPSRPEHVADLGTCPFTPGTRPSARASAALLLGVFSAGERWLHADLTGRRPQAPGNAAQTDEAERRARARWLRRERQREPSASTHHTTFSEALQRPKEPPCPRRRGSMPTSPRQDPARDIRFAVTSPCTFTP